MKLLSLFITILGLTAHAGETPTLTLTDRNTLVMRNVFDAQSVGAVQQAAMKLSNNLAKNETIYLYLDTPGGDIQAGTELIQTLKGLPQKIATVTNSAASMGFITVQSLGTRYILPGGILMAHRAKGGMSGQIPGELNTRVKFFTQLITDIDSVMAARVGLGKSAYQKLIKDEHWVYGQRAVDSKMADKVTLVRCDRSLTEKQVKETVNTFFGPVRVTYSGCPIIGAPLDISFSEIDLSSYDAKEKITLEGVRRAVLTLLYNKQSFYNDYVLTNKVKSVFP